MTLARLVPPALRQAQGVPSRSKHGPPRLVVRTATTTFATVAIVLAAVFVVLLVDVRERVRRSVAERLDAGQRVFSTLEARRQRELHTQVAMLAENPTLKAALDTYASERGDESPQASSQLRETIQREIEKLAERFQVDVIAVADATERTVATAGRLSVAWPLGFRPPAGEAVGSNGSDQVVMLPTGVFRVLTVPLAVEDAVIGALYVATGLTDQYAAELAELAGTPIAILINGRVLGTTVTGSIARDLVRVTAETRQPEGIVQLGGEAHAFRRLFQAGPAEFYAVGSIESAAAVALRDALARLALIALGAMLLAGVGSFALARTLSRPIDRLAREIVAMRESGRVERGIAATGSSRELDALAGTFNDLMASVAAAEEATQAASVGAIRALAAALDARDPYTAGHSERVSALAVAVGREMQLPGDELHVLRLGALLHDIGKIGVSDDVLRKPGRLTREEFETIKLHTTLGAGILRPVPFLARHIPIVELHHENPDGKGYPHGLHGDEIPLLASIVHVADAFDAITSARAYRPGRGSSDAVAELWRCAGSQFDAEVVAALVRALPSFAMAPAALDGAWLHAATAMNPGGAVLAFPVRSSPDGNVANVAAG